MSTHVPLQRVGVRELRQQASALLRRVAAGEAIEVTDHGHPVARIVPIRAGALEQLIADGQASDVQGDLLDVAGELGLPVGGSPPSVALTELRSDER